MFYRKIPTPTRESFDIDKFILDAMPPKGPGLRKDVTISAGIVAVVEEVFYPDNRLTGLLIFIPYLTKDVLKWPTP